MTATAFKLLSYLGLILGIILSFWVLRWGALCFLFSIACANLASSARADTHASQIHETLFVVLSVLGQVNKKIDEVNATARLANTDNHEPVHKLRNSDL